jgi:hypothetical protein
MILTNAHVLISRGGARIKSVGSGSLPGGSFIYTARDLTRSTPRVSSSTWRHPDRHARALASEINACPITVKSAAMPHKLNRLFL